MGRSSAIALVLALVACGGTERRDLRGEEAAPVPAGGGAGGQGAAASSGTSGAGQAATTSAGGGAGAPRLEGYEGLTAAALGLAANLCRCLGQSTGPALDGCAFADAHEFAGTRIDSPDSKRCFEQELAPRFPEQLDCEVRYVESLRDCTAGLTGPNCYTQASTCTSKPSCGTLPDYAIYREQKRRCAEVLYCADGGEASGWRCNEIMDCPDGSDEAGCE